MLNRMWSMPAWTNIYVSSVHGCRAQVSNEAGSSSQEKNVPASGSRKSRMKTCTRVVVTNTAALMKIRRMNMFPLRKVCCRSVKNRLIVSVSFSPHHDQNETEYHASQMREMRHVVGRIIG